MQRTAPQPFTLPRSPRRGRALPPLIAVAAAVVAAAAFGQFASSEQSAHQARQRINSTLAWIKPAQNAIDRFYQQHGRLPEATEELPIWRHLSYHASTETRESPRQLDARLEFDAHTLRLRFAADQGPIADQRIEWTAQDGAARLAWAPCPRTTIAAELLPESLACATHLASAH